MRSSGEFSTRRCADGGVVLSFCSGLGFADQMWPSRELPGEQDSLCSATCPTAPMAGCIQGEFEDF